LLVLSRHPIESVRFETFSLPARPPRLDHPDYYGGKGFVRARLRTPEGIVNFIDTHLHARYGNDVSHEYRAYRVGQIVQLAMETLRTNEPLIVVGDFNIRQSDPEYRVLQGLTGLRDAAAESDTSQPTITRSNPYRSTSDKPDRRIDFVFVRDGVQRRILSQTTRIVFDEVFPIAGEMNSYSDHVGVWAEFVLEPAPRIGRPFPEPEAVRMASQLLAQGMAEAHRRRRSDRLLAGGGLGAAALAALGGHDRRVSRRRLLRNTLRGIGILGLTPGIGFSLLSEVFAPDELRTFERLDAQLSKMPSPSQDIVA
jgi:endonuclease/exonuclease/phosphatase family metal-dependent hydrolase